MASNLDYLEYDHQRLLKKRLSIIIICRLSFPTHKFLESPIATKESYTQVVEILQCTEVPRLTQEVRWLVALLEVSAIFVVAQQFMEFHLQVTKFFAPPP
jgi:hypothetical protein